MENLFFNIDYASFNQMLIKLGVFLLTNGLLIYACYFALSKLLFRKSRQRKELSLRLAFLWSLFAYFVLFNVYLFALIFVNGTDAFQWTAPKSYLGIAPQLTVYLGLTVYFFIKRKILKQIINNNSIN
ncbi:MAG: hypothetical protein LBC19_03245 [Tannerella sp.]|jgi:hypothetical protein|nr:hypothetical protein [Tannerella sp.]